jgi:hypothetical protein
MILEIAVVALCLLVAVMGVLCSVLTLRVSKLEEQMKIVNRVISDTIWGGR